MSVDPVGEGWLQRQIRYYIFALLFVIFDVETVFIFPWSVGLPGLNGFVGEFLILVGSFANARWWVVVATTGVILSALYLLWAYQRVFHGEPDEANRSFPDVTLREGLLLSAFVAVILFTGIYPKPMLSRIEPSVKALIEHVEQNSNYRQPQGEVSE